MLVRSGVLGSVEPRGEEVGESRDRGWGAIASGEGTDAPGVAGGLAGDGPDPAPLKAARRAKRRLLICKQIARGLSARVKDHETRLYETPTLCFVTKLDWPYALRQATFVYKTNIQLTSSWLSSLIFSVLVYTLRNTWWIHYFSKFCPNHWTRKTNTRASHKTTSNQSPRSAVWRLTLSLVKWRESIENTRVILVRTSWLETKSLLCLFLNLCVRKRRHNNSDALCLIKDTFSNIAVIK